MEELLKDSKFKGMLDKKSGGFMDPRTGLFCQLEIIYDDPKTYALCIPGIAEGEMLGTQLSASVQQFLGVGGVPEIYRQALELAKLLNEKLTHNKGQPLQLTGHSMGGGIANYVGLKLDLPSNCFNAAALGRACLKDIGDVSMEVLNKQTHIRVENDFATHPPVTRKLLAFFSLGREKWVPRNVGVICEIKKDDRFYPHGQSMMGRHLLDSVKDWCHQLPLSKLQ